MRNFVQPGEVVTVPAPAGGVSSGAGVQIGALFGVAAFNAETSVPVEIKTVGVFDLPKRSAAVFAVGSRVYWDSVLKQCDDVPGSEIGIAVAVSGNGTATARVRLNGAAVPGDSES